MGLLTNNEKQIKSNTDVITNDGIIQDTMKGATHYILQFNLKNKLVATKTLDDNVLYVNSAVSSRNRLPIQK